jgi:uncharacterized protein YrrD
MPQTRQVHLGSGVFSRDGDKLGTVDRLVFNSENQHLEELVVHKGILSGDKLIDLDLVDHVEGDRVVLSLPASEAKRLPDFAETQYVEAPVDDLSGYPGVAAGPFGAGTLLYGGPGLGLGYPGGGFSPYASVPMDTTVVENISNLPEQDVVVGSGSDVIGADGKKVGTVDRVLYGDDGILRGVVVKAGFVFKHDVTIPGDWVAELDEGRIRLNVTGDEARAQGAN